VDPPHYGTEDVESGEDAVMAAGLPERFAPLMNRVRSLMLLPPRDWKYQVELDDDPDEKGEIERCTRALAAFAQVWRAPLALPWTRQWALTVKASSVRRRAVWSI